ncbi:MAG: hypothetical protein JO279_18990 [Verrucomicrobia bacterium]|nr:hypothetical protein [Verrucomicrobiota bacterium]
MKWQAIIISFVLLSALAGAHAEDSPSQPPTPSSSEEELDEPALPTPETAPSDSVPGLLPESGELPAGPPANASKLTLPRGSAQQVSETGGRFDEIRSLAMSNARAAYLLKRARSSSRSVSRRTYLRAYYMTVAARMRKLDPKLKSAIDAYEEEKMREAAATSSTARVSHQSGQHRTAHLAVHHRSHRVSFAHRYRRFYIIDGPYGPDFPPFGPPVVFDPW